MEKRKDLSLKKKGQISVLLKRSGLKQKEIAKKLNISTQTISATKELENGRNIHTSRAGKCGGKGKQHLGLIKKIKTMALKDRRASCKKLSMELSNQDIIADRKTINNRFLEQGLKA